MHLIPHPLCAALIGMDKLSIIFDSGGFLYGLPVAWSLRHDCMRENLRKFRTRWVLPFVVALVMH